MHNQQKCRIESRTVTNRHFYLLSNCSPKKFPMPSNPQLWSAAMEWMQIQAVNLPKAWPPELPPEDKSKTEDFWRQVCRHEMTTRNSLSTKIRMLLDGSEPPSISALESWLLWRRFEWAGQIIMAKASQNIAPPDDVPLTEVLDWALVRTWETDGCVEVWNHSERGGVPHPENPEGFSPLPLE